VSRHSSQHGGSGPGGRRSHTPPAATLQVQKKNPEPEQFPFQPLPENANGKPPYHFDLSQLIPAEDVAAIKTSGVMICHTVGDTGDYRGEQMDFVAAMMTHDAANLPGNAKLAFYYHLGDVIYFAGDIDKYGDNFYETYSNYPGFIVSIPGNHDCQPDDPNDGPVDPNKKPLDGWIQNFMAPSANLPGSSKTTSVRTRMDLPYVYWTFTTPFATFIGLFSNVGETQGQFDATQVKWFQGEVKAADPHLPLIVAVHHPPFSGDTEHSGSSNVEKVLWDAFSAAKRYPDLILSGHVHNYQRFTYLQGKVQIPCVVAGAGGYTKLGTLPQINGAFPDPDVPLKINDTLQLERYDQDNFGFLRLEISKSQISGTYFSAPYVAGSSPVGGMTDRWRVDVAARTVQTLS
jgi:hypothetical protein